MDKQKLLKKVKENFKKKRKRWKIECEKLENIEKAYDMSYDLLLFFDNSFNEEEKEKFNYNNLILGVTPIENNLYKVDICFGK